MLSDIFDGIAWENGAVICLIATNEVYLPFGYLSPSLVSVLEEAGLPLKHSPVIAATWTPYREMVWKVLDSWGGF